MNEKRAEIAKMRATRLVDDNIRHPVLQDYLLMEQAVLIGMSLQQELDAIDFIADSYKCEDDEALEIWRKTTNTEL